MKNHRHRFSQTFSVDQSFLPYKMSSQSEDDCPGYDQDLIVRELTSLYQFLTRIHIDPSSILLPPNDGWPDLTPEILQRIGKTDRANELLRHLPYVECGDYGEKYTIWKEAACMDYRNERLIDDIVGHMGIPW